MEFEFFIGIDVSKNELDLSPRYRKRPRLWYVGPFPLPQASSLVVRRQAIRNAAFEREFALRMAADTGPVAKACAV